MRELLRRFLEVDRVGPVAQGLVAESNLSERKVRSSSVSFLPASLAFSFLAIERTQMLTITLRDRVTRSSLVSISTEQNHLRYSEKIYLAE